MITDDHAATAGAIARDLGIAGDAGTLTGHDLDALADRGLADRVREVDVYARTTPEHKLRLVRALQAHGDIVAMTGDGVNDAPALKRADIGGATGQRGTEAAKQASEMVLADDNFASITAAVQEGRIVYDKLIKAILMAAVLGLFLWAAAQGTPVAEARTLVVNMLVAGEIAYLFSVRVLAGPALSRHALATARPAVIAIALVGALQVAFTYAGPLQVLFDTAPLSTRHWLEIGGLALVVLAVVEGEKGILRRVRRRLAPAGTAARQGSPRRAT